MIKISVTSPETRHMKGIGKTSGKPYDFHIQTAYAHTISDTGVISDFPDKFEFTLRDGQAPYPRGAYELAPNAIAVSRDGKLEIVTVLKPVPAVKQ